MVMRRTEDRKWLKMIMRWKWNYKCYNRLKNRQSYNGVNIKSVTKRKRELSLSYIVA